MWSRLFQQVCQFGIGLAACLALIWILAPGVLDIRLSHAPQATDPTRESDRSLRDVTPAAAEPVVTDDRFKPVPDSAAALKMALESSASPTSVTDSHRTSRFDIAALRRPPVGDPDLAAIQHTPTGRVRLGRHLFERLIALDRLNDLYVDVQYWINRRAKPITKPNVRPDPPIVGEPLWPQLADWWDEHGDSIMIRWSFDGTRAFQRFHELADKSRSATEDEELWELVVTCGRDWLRIPYDEHRERFDLDADLPTDAPETALHCYREMYRIMAGQEWGTILTDDDVTLDGVDNPGPQDRQRW